MSNFAGKGTTKFADVQILSGKVLGVLKVLRVIDEK